MRIAVASDGLEVAPYLESCTNYNCFKVSNGRLVDYQNLPILDTQSLSLADLFKELGIDVLIVGCLQKPTRKVLENHGITVLCGAKGEAKHVVENYLTETFISCDGSCDERHEEETSSESELSLRDAG